MVFWNQQPWFSGQIPDLYPITTGNHMSQEKHPAKLFPYPTKVPFYAEYVTAFVEVE